MQPQLLGRSSYPNYPTKPNAPGRESRPGTNAGKTSDRFDCLVIDHHYLAAALPADAETATCNLSDIFSAI